ncbi:MAG: threonine synthase [Pseudomonadota bacterium]
MNFIETRGNDGVLPQQVSFSQAILSPMCSFGGIYVPKNLPQMETDFLAKQVNSDYKTLAAAILAKFEIDIAQQVIDQALSLYDAFDDPKQPVPVVKIKDDLYVSELYHGPTRAFKDIALQPFGLLLSEIAKQRQEKFLILAATSGDTGPAALETFKNKANVQVACLYPDGGTSDVQRLQMVTEDASNLKVIGIKGNFDDAQQALKKLLGSATFKEKLKQQHISLSAANSVNFGRIIFQIIYHVHSYLELVRQDAIKLGEKVYLNVPSGNFGNALGGFYAMRMGLPVEKIMIASNANNVLTELINNGSYDISDKSLITTTSPAMDILKSSNIERILYDLFGANRTKELMAQLDEQKKYQLSSTESKQLQAIFVADYCDDKQGKAYIKECFDSGYLLDPHTATCLKTYYSKKTKALKSIIYSTAEWTKFSPTIANAISKQQQQDMDDIDALKSIASTANISIPVMIDALFDKPVAQKTIIDKQDIEQEILKFL